MTDPRLADLAALDSFVWIVGDPETEGASAEDYADRERIMAATHAHYADDIAARRREIAGALPDDRVSFDLLEGEPWACTDLRIDRRRAA